MRRTWVVRAAGAILLSLASIGPDALAQQESSAPPPAEDEPAPGAGDPGPASVQPPPGIEAIEVTGERLNDANVQDEAQAISAFTGADLDRANIVSVDSLAFNVPGLHVGQSAQAPIITLR